MKIHCLANGKCKLAYLIANKRVFALNESLKLIDAFHDLINDFLAHDKESALFSMFCSNMLTLHFYQRIQILIEILRLFHDEITCINQAKRKRVLNAHNCYR